MPPSIDWDLFDIESRRVCRRLNRFQHAQIFCLAGVIVGHFELNRWHVVERFVDASVVEPINVVERGPFDLFDVAPGSFAMDEFGLVETVEAFGEGIVIGVAFGSNRRDDLGFAQSLGVAN
jgi:hypothetical protein